MKRIDAVVVGGGLAGMAAAVAVAKAGLETVHLAPKGAARPAHLGADAAQRRLPAGSRPDRRSCRPGPSADPDPHHRRDRPAAAFARNAVRQRRGGPCCLRLELRQRQADRGLRGGAGRAAQPHDPRRDPHRAGEFGRRNGTSRSATVSVLQASLVVGPTARSLWSAPPPASGPASTASPQAALVCDLELGPRRSAAPRWNSTTRRGRSRWCPPAATGRIWSGSTTAPSSRPRRQAAGPAARGVPREVAAPVRRHQARYARATSSRSATSASTMPGPTASCSSARRRTPSRPSGRRGSTSGCATSLTSLPRWRRPTPGPPAGQRRSARTTRSGVSPTSPGPAPWSMACSGRCSPICCRRRLLRAGGLWALKLLPPLRKQAFNLGMGAR